jgi:hypothetical protein
VAKEGADTARIEKEIKEMPNYFADYDTTVHFVSAEELKANHSRLSHGGFVIRTGKTGLNNENSHVIEYSLKLDSNPEFTASVLVCYARAAGRLPREGVGIYDPEMEDLIGLIYSEVKRRGGIYKLHCDGNANAPCIDKVYDYLWIGENQKATTLGVGKNFHDYVVPCQDKVTLNLDNPDYYFASVIPFMQFPLLTTRGRPFLGKRKDADCPNYGREDPKYNREYLFDCKVDDYMKTHPDGPYVYSLWSAVATKTSTSPHLP